MITGASSETGIQLLKEIYADYHTIYLQYRNWNDELGKAVTAIGREVDVVPFEVDLQDQDQVFRMIRDLQEKEHLPNHIVHLPAPKVYHKQFHKDRWDHFQYGWEVSVRPAVEILQMLIPEMSRNRYGRIVFMLTSYTLNHPPKFLSCYVTVKYALLGLMNALSAEYAGKGITINGISPDMMETKFLSEISNIMIEQNAANSPLGRNINIGEVLPVIKYMLSDAGAAMTGQNIGITGGM